MTYKVSFLFTIILTTQAISTSFRHLDKEGFISINFCVATENEFLISPIKIGTPEQEMNLVLDISAERTWISNVIFLHNESSSYSTDNYIDKRTQDDFAYRGVWSKENIIVGDKELKNFDFLYVDKIDNNELFQGVLSLGREYDSKKFSLVYKMSSASATFYNSFVLRFVDNNKGELHIGDLTNELKDYTHLMSPCTLVNIEEKIKWACELTHVFVGPYGDNSYTDQYTNEKGFIISSKSSKIKNINQPAIFETIYNKIYVPKDFIIYLKENVFIDQNNSQEICKLNEDTSSSFFTCNQNEIDKVQKINFVMSNKLALTLPSSNLFACNGETCTYLVMYKEGKKNWIMGLPILKTYQMIFDYNKKDLNFYSNDNKSFVRMPSTGGSTFTTFLFYLFIFVVVAIVGGIGFIYFLRRKNKKRKMIEEEIYENF